MLTWPRRAGDLPVLVHVVLSACAGSPSAVRKQRAQTGSAPKNVVCGCGHHPRTGFDSSRNADFQVPIRTLRGFLQFRVSESKPGVPGALADVLQFSEETENSKINVIATRRGGIGRRRGSLMRPRWGRIPIPRSERIMRVRTPSPGLVSCEAFCEQKSDNCAGYQRVEPLGERH